LLKNETLDAFRFNQLIGRSAKPEQEHAPAPVTLAPPNAASGDGEQSHTE